MLNPLDKMQPREVDEQGVSLDAATTPEERTKTPQPRQAQLIKSLINLAFRARKACLHSLTCARSRQTIAAYSILATGN